MDWTDIEARLCARAEDVCRHLFPNGQRVGAEFVVGSLAGEKGDSLKINLSGKVGLWSDFADGGKGGKSLCSLWMQARGLPKFGAAVFEAKKFLGIADDYQRRVKPAVATPSASTRNETAWADAATVWADCQPLTEGGPVWTYLTTGRGLAPEALAVLEVRELLGKGGQWAMVFPYYAPPVEEDGMDGLRESIVKGKKNAAPVKPIPAWLKFELLDRPNGKKREWTTKGPEKTLFGLQLSEHFLFKKARHVLICEGEKDAATWLHYGCAEWGIVPVSVPFGAKWKGQDKSRPSPNREWLDRCWDWLQSFETVFIAMDGDEPGRRAAADIIAEIGPRRCRLVTLPPDDQEQPHKDANACLQAGVPAELMKAALDLAQDFSPEKVRAAAEYEAEFLAEWFEHELEPGLELPFASYFKIRGGEMTVWTGIEKSGKTTALGFCINALMKQGERVMIASFEVKPVKTLKKLSRQAWGGLIYDDRIVKRCGTDAGALANYRATARDQATQTFKWLAGNLWLYDHVGIGRWQQLIDDIRWARRRLGITQFVVDNFMRLGIVKDDYAQQADAIIAFAGLAMEMTDIHIHMVVHQNKSEGNKGGQGGKRSVSGAFEIIANAHNIVEVTRDEKKGEQVSDLWNSRENNAIGDAEFNTQKAALDQKPDGKFTMHAQRDGERQNASTFLWFLWESQQYVDKPPGHALHAPLRFVEVARQTPPSDLPTREELFGE